jgi:hypothetical protein
MMIVVAFRLSFETATLDVFARGQGVSSCRAGAGGGKKPQDGETVKAEAPAAKEEAQATSLLRRIKKPQRRKATFIVTLVGRRDHWIRRAGA